MNNFSERIRTLNNVVVVKGSNTLIVGLESCGFDFRRRQVPRRLNLC